MWEVNPGRRRDSQAGLCRAKGGAWRQRVLPRGPACGAAAAGRTRGRAEVTGATSRGDHTLACPGVTSTVPSCLWGTPQVAPNGGATAQRTDQGEPFPQCQAGVCPVSREKDSLLDQILAMLLSPLPNSQPGLSLDL